MGWSGSLSANSAVGSEIIYTPDTTTEGAYTVSAFTAPKKGIYRFILKGSGGTSRHSWSNVGTPGTGGYTVGYLLLEKDQTVYIGAGGTCSAAFVSKATGAALKNIAKENLFFVAGAGGGNGNGDYGGNNGGAGGGTTGGSGGTGGGTGGAGGTQTAGGSNTSQAGYGYGNGGGYSNENDVSYWGGRGGDGLYGGSGGFGMGGGGGGSGYIHTGSVKAGSKTYTNTTQQDGGASGGSVGSVVVAYYARAELPVVFDGTTLERLLFNGVEIESLIVDGVKLFFRRLMKKIRERRGSGDEQLRFA